ncbi:hypothetical protein EXIGLDRAFT_725197 [Exidia glandulosa HHB12029]|uniref:F-box domain-containing protein n=1 Tax=Exidia glandulosa HHB12029 TaxID=1314781 RepID=A0A165E509_EXIGL|nr:hypothetical protein EXIGLDRAFT_725197 [Exidia glandulosa HHB12029]
MVGGEADLERSSHSSPPTMSLLHDGPAELVALVFDSLSLRELILASHVCRSWRTIARAHPIFYGEARLVARRPLTAELPEVQLFMARISTVCGPVAVTALVYTLTSVVDDLVLPALSTHMHRIKSLRVSLPEEYSIPFRRVLDQPAPALRRFMLEHYRGALAMVMPIGTWALPESQPALPVPRYELTEIPALQGVRDLRMCLPWYCGNVDLKTIFTLFPNVRHLDLERVMPGSLLVPGLEMADHRRSVLLQQLEPLGTRLETIASSLQSLIVEDPSPSALASLQVSNIPVVTVTTIDRFSSDILNEALRPFSNFRASVKGGLITCTSFDRPERVYKATSTASRIVFDVFLSSLSTLPPLVAFSVEMDPIEGEISVTIPLPFVEHLHLVSHTRLKRSRGALPPLFRCDNLSVVVLQFQTKSAYTYRGIADYLECTLTTTDWSAITVVLHNIATVGARPPSVLPRIVTWEDVADEEEYAWLNECVKRCARTNELLSY